MRFILNKDKVTLEGYFDTNVSGTIKYYEIPIEHDETWENLVIKAIIVNKDEDTGEEISVINNKFFIDKKKSGTYRVGFVGYTIENEQKVYQVSTDLVSFIIDKGAGEIEGVESHDIPTPSEWEVYIAQIQSMVDDFEDKIPTKLSQLQNDNHTVQDENYVHTDNNFSNEDKTKLDSLENYDDTEIKDDIQEINGDIDEINTNLLNYSLITETGAKIDLEINPTTYVLIAKLYDKNNNLISTSSQIDLPIESMVVSGSYDSVNKKIILTLDNGNTIDIPIGDLISGLQAEITSENKLESDLVDDTNQNNKFVTTQEKETWNEKYYKPNGGIPKTDLSSEVQESLDKADTAIQESDLEDYVTNDTLEASQAIQDEKITAIEKQIPTGEVNDTSITLTDSADYKVKEFGIEGNTEQATRSGKNFFDIDKVISNWDTSTNMGVKNNSNGTLTVSTPAGSTTVLALSPNKLSDYCPNLKVGDVVYLNATTTGTNKYIYLNVSSSLWMFGASRTITQDDLDSAVYWYASGVNTTATITNIMVSTSNIDTYEPYGASPSPDYPSPVNTITGDIEVKVQNGNLFDVEAFEKEIVSRKILNDNGIETTDSTSEYSTYQIPVKANQTIHINGWFQRIYLFDTNKRFISRTTSYDGTGIKIKPDFNFIPNTDGYIEFQIYRVHYNFNKGTEQVVKGTTAGEYIPHQEQNYPISLGVENLIDETTLTLSKTTDEGKQVYIIYGTSGETSINYLLKKELKENTQYTLSFVGKQNQYFNRVIFKYTDNTSSVITFTNSDYEKCIATSQANKTVNGIQIDTGAYSAQNYIEVGTIQLVEGTKEQRVSDNPIELCKIGDYQDYIYKENGNWYKYGNVIKRNLKDFNYSRTVLANGNILFSINLNYFGNATSINVLCSHLLGIADNQGNVLNSIRFNQGHNLYIVVADNEISSSTTNFKNWCETNNVYALFKSTNPVITPITDTTLINQLNALEQAYTYKGVTHIDTDVETKPYLKVVYRKDIGLILEKIENLEARVSLLE